MRPAAWRTSGPSPVPHHVQVIDNTSAGMNPSEPPTILIPVIGGVGTATPDRPERTGGQIPPVGGPARRQQWTLRVRIIENLG